MNDDDDHDEFGEFFNDMLPDDAIANHAIRVLSYMDKDGEFCTSFVVHGTREMIPVMGSLEWCKLAAFEKRYDEDDDG